MKQAEWFVTLALVLSLVAIPAIASAQGGSGTGGGIGAGPNATPEGGIGWDQRDRVPAGARTYEDSKSDSGKIQPGTNMMPGSANDCRDRGYRMLGFKTEAECLAQVKQ
jgi:hypothetical protein